MSGPKDDQTIEREPRGVIVRLPGLTLSGPSAVLAAMFILILIAGLVAYMRPSARMLLSAALWIAFVVYWSIAAKHASPSKSSESLASRKLHQYLMNVALLLLFVPVPGLKARFCYF